MALELRHRIEWLLVAFTLIALRGEAAELHWQGRLLTMLAIALTTWRIWRPQGREKGLSNE